MVYAKPLPKVTTLDQPFWAAAQRHELRLQQCLDCRHIWFPAYANCPKCLSTHYEWSLMSGMGKVWSFTIFHQLYFKSFAQELPYNVAFVELQEGPKLMSNIVGCSNEEIRCDMPVQVTFNDVTDDITLPKFTPVHSGQSR